MRLLETTVNRSQEFNRGFETRIVLTFASADAFDQAFCAKNPEFCGFKISMRPTEPSRCAKYTQWMGGNIATDAEANNLADAFVQAYDALRGRWESEVLPYLEGHLSPVMAEFNSIRARTKAIEALIVTPEQSQDTLESNFSRLSDRVEVLEQRKLENPAPANMDHWESQISCLFARVIALENELSKLPREKPKTTRPKSPLFSGGNRP